ncbi:hypothetical protein Tco_0711551 [Tanacetum coccineum]
MDTVIRCTTLPSHSRSLKGFLLHFSQRSIHFYRLSHSELDDIEKVVVCSSLRLLNTKSALLMGFNSLVHSFHALSTLRRSGLRTASAAVKPCQGDSLEFYLITGILTVAATGQNHILSQARWNNAKDHYTKYKDIIKDYELERMNNSKTAELQLVFSGVTSLRGRLLGKLIQKLLLNQKYMGYLVRAYYSISPTRYYKDDSWWSADLKSKAIDDIISIGSFVEALVLNHYVLVRKILIMNPQETQQVVARNEKWVPSAERVKISSTNIRLETTVPQKEETFQVIIDVIKNSTAEGKGSKGRYVEESQEMFEDLTKSIPESVEEVLVEKVLRLVVFQGHFSALKSKTCTLKTKLKGAPTHTPQAKEATVFMQALKESKKTSRRQPGTGGSNEGTGSKPGVPDESTVVSATSSEGTGTKPGVHDEEKDIIEEKVILEWGDEQDNEFLDDDNDDVEKDDKDGDADDEGDDHVSDTQDADKTIGRKLESVKDEFKFKITCAQDEIVLVIQFLNTFFCIFLSKSVKILQMLMLDAFPVLVILEDNQFSSYTVDDHTSEALAVLQSQVPMVVDSYLDTKYLHELTKKPTPTAEQESEKSPLEILNIKKEQAESQKNPQFTIKSTDKAALKEYDLKSALYQSMHANKTVCEEPIAGRLIIDVVGDDVVRDDINHNAASELRLLRSDSRYAIPTRRGVISVRPLFVALRMFTRSLILKRRVEDLQLGVESYQKKLNITKPQKTFPEIEFKEPYTQSYNLPGIVYEGPGNTKKCFAQLMSCTSSRMAHSSLFMVRFITEYSNFVWITTRICQRESGWPLTKRDRVL